MPKLERIKLRCRVLVGTLQQLNQIARDMGYTYGQGAALGRWLDDLASGKLTEDWKKIEALKESIDTVRQSSPILVQDKSAHPKSKVEECPVHEEKDLA